MADQTTPPSLPSQVSPSRTAPIAIWSLVLAIFSFFCGWLFTAIPAVICGHIARSKIQKSGGALGGKGIATAGLVVGYFAVAIGILGIPLLVDMLRSDRERLRRLAAERQEITSDDEKLKVTTSGFWVKQPGLNKEAVLQTSYKSEEMYLIVISDSKAALPNMTLEKHHQTTKDHMLQKMQNSSATDPVSLTIDGHPALQDEVSGTENGLGLVFLHTTVNEDDHFHQVLAWTLKSRWQKHNEELREITGSFHCEK